MTELTFAILKYGFVACLWIFAWLAIRSLHKDVNASVQASHRGKRSRSRRHDIYAREQGAPAVPEPEPGPGSQPRVPAPPQPTRPVQQGQSGASSEAYTAYRLMENPGSDNAIESPFLAHLVNATESREAVQSGKKMPSPTMLVIIDGPRAGYTVPLEGKPITLGRGTQNSIVLSDEYVSGRHARVFPDRATGQWKLEDLGSTNGTYVNEARINGAITLPARVPVRIGATSFELR
jgi:hypothetical protein